MIYADNAATTLVKPHKVAEAVKRAVMTCASVGRGGYEAAARAADTVFNAREMLALFFGAPSPESVVFTANATHALNIAIKGLLKPGGYVLHSGYEHNAVMRQIYAAELRGARRRQIEAPLFEPEKTLAAWRSALDEQPATLAVLCHVSNVFGSIAPAEEIAAACASRGVPLVLDAAQSAGHIPVDMRALPGTFVCAAGHKGLFGPQGTGVLILPEGMALDPLIEGGTGGFSLPREMPLDSPDRFEAGTHNVPGAAGLAEGVSFLLAKGLDSIAVHERKLAELLCDKLASLPAVTLYRAGDFTRQTGVVSFTVDGFEAERFADLLSQHGVAVRAGYHCAPLAHFSAGTGKNGTVRVSFSAFNTEREIYALARIMTSIVS